jgi:RNase P subunit RPR2
VEEQKEQVVEQEKEYIGEPEMSSNEDIEPTRKKDDTDTGKIFEYGDLTVTCGACGHEQRVQKSVKGGIQLPALYTVEKAHLTIACEKCKNSMKLHFKETAPEDIIVQEEEANNDVQKESKE